MAVEEIIDNNIFNQVLKDSKLVAVHFWAEWSDLCRVTEPLFEQYSEIYPIVKFFKVDIEKNEEVALFYSIRSLPTFMFFKDGEKVDVFSGADHSKVKQKLNNLTE